MTTMMMIVAAFIGNLHLRHNHFTAYHPNDVRQICHSSGNWSDANLVLVQNRPQCHGDEGQFDSHGDQAGIRVGVSWTLGSLAVS